MRSGFVERDRLIDEPSAGRLAERPLARIFTIFDKAGFLVRYELDREYLDLLEIGTFLSASRFFVFRSGPSLRYTDRY